MLDQIDSVTSPVDPAKQQKSPTIAVESQLDHNVQCRLYSCVNCDRFIGGGESSSKRRRSIYQQPGTAVPEQLRPDRLAVRSTTKEDPRRDPTNISERENPPMIDEIENEYQGAAVANRQSQSNSAEEAHVAIRGEEASKQDTTEGRCERKDNTNSGAAKHRNNTIQRSQAKSKFSTHKRGCEVKGGVGRKPQESCQGKIDLHKGNTQSRSSEPHQEMIKQSRSRTLTCRI